MFLSEIENFLTEQECNDIILMAQTQGLEQSKTFGEVNFKDEDAKNETSALEDPAETFKLLDLNNDEHLDAGEVGIYNKPVNCDRPGECSPEKDC